MESRPLNSFRPSGPAAASRRVQHGKWDSHFWKSWSVASGEEGSLHVAGVVTAPSPGYTATIARKPPGDDSRLLELELAYEELPGAWPDVTAPIPAVYEMRPYHGEFDRVRVPGVGILIRRLPLGSSHAAEPRPEEDRIGCHEPERVTPR
jgi:hypothetical protein